MAENKETPVLIVGAKPVGITLAMDLAWLGIDVTVVERRHSGEPPEPKCNHVSARSMEIYRRLGIAAKLRNVGLPEDYTERHLLSHIVHRYRVRAYSYSLPT